MLIYLYGSNVRVTFLETVTVWNWHGFYGYAVMEVLKYHRKVHLKYFARSEVILCGCSWMHSIQSDLKMSRYLCMSLCRFREHKMYKKITCKYKCRFLDNILFFWSHWDGQTSIYTFQNPCNILISPEVYLPHGWYYKLY